MITIEQVNKLREYADVSYEEAKRALENTDGNVLEALIELEQQGKTKSPEGGGKYVSNLKLDEEEESTAGGAGKKAKSKPNSGSSFGESMRRLFAWLGRIVQKGNINYLVVERHNEHIIRLPLTIMVLLLVFAFWVIIPLLIVGLFFNFKYTFDGPDVGSDKVNRVMDDVAKAAEDIKSDIKKDLNKEKD